MDRKKAIALSFSVPVAWGFSYPLMKIGMDSMNATSIVALRCIIAFVVCLLLFHKHALRINRDLMVRAAIIGAIMATELTCMCLGSSLTSASTAGFLQSLTVVIVPFANAALLRRAPERHPGRQWGSGPRRLGRTRRQRSRPAQARRRSRWSRRVRGAARASG